MMERRWLPLLAAAALGGLDSMVGAVLGGLVVGLARNLLVTFLDLSELALATAVAVILVVLLVRPTGLLGSTRVDDDRSSPANSGRMMSQKSSAPVASMAATACCR